MSKETDAERPHLPPTQDALASPILKLQEYTDYEQSMSLNRLGAQQVVSQGMGQRYFFTEGIGGVPVDTVWCGATIDFRTQIKFPEQHFVRRYSFQEMLFDLMAHYEVELLNEHIDATGGGGYVELRWGEPNDYNELPCQQFHFYSLDPFPAVYDAYCWHLKRRLAQNA